jgi:uncharacterized delta-60 repeat protein
MTATQTNLPVPSLFRSAVSIFFLSLVLLVLIVSNAKAQVGELDQSFDIGVVLNQSTPGVVRAHLVSGNQHLIAGEFTSIGGVARGNLARLDANGSLDDTYATGVGANGPIHTIAFDSSGRLLIGGDFTSFNGVARNRIARLTSNGDIDLTFNPGNGCNGSVYSIAIAGSSIYLGGEFTTYIYLGGEFTTYDGVTRNRLAVITSTGSLASQTFNGGVNAAVRALRLDNQASTLYIAGNFTIAGGATRNYFAQFSTFSGAVGGTDLGFNAPVRTFDFSTSASYSSDKVWYIGGDFTMVGSVPRGRLACFKSSYSGKLILDGEYNFWLDAPCRKIVVSGSTKVLVGGDFTTVNGQWRSRFAEMSLISSSSASSSSSSSYWDLLVGYGETGPDGPVYTLGLDSESRPILGGAFAGFQSVGRNACLRLYGDAGSQPPATPASASALTLSDTQIYVAWSSSAFASAYTVEGSSDGTAGWTVLYNGASTSFTEAGLSAGSQRFYRIRASNYNGPGSSTASVSATTNTAAWAGSGSLHNSLPPGSINGAVSAIFRQPDGKIMIAGSFTSVLGNPRKYIARLLPDLTLDANFNPGTSANSPITQIEPAPNGGVYIFGSFSTVNGVTRNDVARLNSTGALDTTFNTNTEWTFSDGIRVQADGKLIVFGNFSTFYGTPRDYIARLNLDGSIDTSFVGVPDWIIDCAAVQRDGKLLLAGWFRAISGIPAKNFVRVESNGLPDPSFVGTATSQNISALVSLPSGKHFAAGSFTSISGVSRQYIARLNENGTLDGTFNPGSSTNTSSPLLFPQPNGKLIITGSFSSVANTTRRKIARLNADGTLDSTFTAEAGPNSGTINSVLTMPDGSLLVGGTFTTFGASSRSYLVQLKGEENSNVPSTPQNLAGTTLTASSIELTWNQLPDEYSWKIERSPAGSGLWQQIAELEWDVTSFTDTQLPTDTSFDYRIRAWNGAGGSTYSNTAIVKTLDAFAQWKLDHNMTVSALDRLDSDGDGMGLFLEYALGLDPNVADSGGMPVANMFGGILTMTYPRLYPELDYVVEASTDLQSWSSDGVNQGSGWYPTAWIMLDKQPRLFLRLRISK